MIDRIFARSRVVNDTSDVLGELKLWLVILAFDSVLVFIPGVYLFTEPESPLLVTVAMFLALFGSVFIVLNRGSYILAPIMLPLGFEFVCQDMSYELYGWVYRPNKGENK